MCYNILAKDRVPSSCPFSFPVLTLLLLCMADGKQISWADLSDIVAVTAKAEDVTAVTELLTNTEKGLGLPEPSCVDGLTDDDVEEMGKIVDVWVQRALC